MPRLVTSTGASPGIHCRIALILVFVKRYFYKIMQIQDHDFMTDGRDMTVKIFDYERSMILEGITEVFLPGPNRTKILV